MLVLTISVVDTCIDLCMISAFCHKFQSTTQHVRYSAGTAADASFALRVFPAYGHATAV